MKNSIVSLPMMISISLGEMGVRTRDTRALRKGGFFIPGLSVLLVALLVTLPWGVPSEFSYVPPLIIMAVIYCWTLRHPGLMPVSLVFVIGIAVDVVTASPIGFWAFLFLFGYAVALRAGHWKLPWPMLTMVLTYVPAAMIVGGLAWGIASAYFGQLMNWQPAFDSVRFSILVSPIVALSTGLIDHWMTKPRLNVSPPKEVM